jgi:hypothetical protein
MHGCVKGIMRVFGERKNTSTAGETYKKQGWKGTLEDFFPPLEN